MKHLVTLAFTAMVSFEGLAQLPMLQGVSSIVPAQRPQAEKAMGAAPRRAVSDLPAIKDLPDLRGAAIYYGGFSGNNFAGIYHFADNGTFRVAGAEGVMYAGGGVEKDGEYFANDGGTFRYGWDTQSWDRIFKGPHVKELSCFYDVALDPTTQDIYGLVEVDGTRYWATIDYVNGTVKTLQPSDIAFYALGFTANGQCYGIQHEGLFGKVDKETGAFTKISDVSLYGLNPGWIGSGCIDAATNRFFWNCVDVGKHSYLVEIDISNGQPVGANNITDYEFYSMWAPTPAARPDAPAKVSNLKTDFKGSLTGTVSFTAPTKTFNGTTGSGVLTYHVLIDNKEAATGLCSWGDNVSVNVTSTAGEHFLKVRCNNEAGLGAKSTQRLFLGSDIPDAPANVKASYANGSFTVSWDAVDHGVNGGYIDTTQVTYVVTMQPSGQQMATVKGKSSASFSYEAQAATQYRFDVIANVDELTSKAGTSNYVVAGAYTAPYSCLFDKETDADVYTIINVNSGKTWTWNSSYKAMYLGQATADDWLITPGIYLEAGKAYFASFDAAGQSPEWKEQIEAFYGTEPTVEAMTNPYVEKTLVATENFYKPQTLGNYILPAQSGIYFIGYHGCSKKGIGVCMTLNNIQIAAGVDARVAMPNAEAIKIVPDIDGGLTSAITISIPQVNMFGQQLEGPLSLSLRRGDEEIATVTDLQPGQVINLTDKVNQTGRYDYSLILTNAYGDCPVIPASAYYGINLPAAPSNITVTEDEHEFGMVTLTWEPATIDVDGNPIKTDYFTYTVTDQNGKVLGKDLKEPKLTVRAVAEGEQEFMTFTVKGVSQAGDGPAAKSSIFPIGKPYEPEHIESFNKLVGEYNTVYSEYPFTWIEGQASTGLYLRNYEYLSIPKSSEEDGGLVLYQNSMVGNNATMIFPKVSFKNVSKPALSYKVYNIGSNDGNVMTTSIICDGDTTVVSEKTVAEIAQDCGTGADAWATCVIDLSDYAGKTIYYTVNVRVVTKVYNYFDHVRVYDNTANDMAIKSFEVPTHAVAGNEFDVNVNVINRGANKAEDYTVTLQRNGTVVEQQKGSPLDNLATQSFTFKQRLNAFDDPRQTYSVNIAYAPDEALNNNSAQALTELTVYDLPMAHDFCADYPESSTHLTWSAPQLSDIPAERTEDFEAATPWSAGPEGWLSIDLDKTGSGYYPAITIPTIGNWNDEVNTRNSSGFFVFNVEDPELVYESNLADLIKQEFGAHSGVSYMASMFASNTDDWLVLPELSGDAQTIKFWGNAQSNSDNAQVEVRYCNDQFSTPSSELLITLSVDYSGWKEYSVDVPQGVKWVALRNRSEEAAMFMVDDVTFRSISDAKRYPVLGYNIYRDGNLIFTGNELSFTEDNQGVCQYAVTVLYPQGESHPVLLSGTTAVNSLLINAQVGNVYDLTGRTIMTNVGRDSLKKLPAGVYIFRGEKVMVR